MHWICLVSLTASFHYKIWRRNMVTDLPILFPSFPNRGVATRYAPVHGRKMTPVNQANIQSFSQLQLQSSVSPSLPLQSWSVCPVVSFWHNPDGKVLFKLNLKSINKSINKSNRVSVHLSVSQWLNANWNTALYNTVSSVVILNSLLSQIHIICHWMLFFFNQSTSHFLSFYLLPLKVLK